jgi:hypothetical protein
LRIGARVAGTHPLPLSLFWLIFGLLELRQVAAAKYWLQRFCRENLCNEEFAVIRAVFDLFSIQLAMVSLQLSVVKKQKAARGAAFSFKSVNSMVASWMELICRDFCTGFLECFVRVGEFSRDFGA